MGFLDSLRNWFRAEAAEAKDVLDHTRARMETDLDRREAELAASPSEKLEMLQEEISAGDDGFEALRDKIEGRSAKADAVEEVAEHGAEGDAGDGPADAGDTDESGHGPPDDTP